MRKRLGTILACGALALSACQTVDPTNKLTSGLTEEPLTVSYSAAQTNAVLFVDNLPTLPDNRFLQMLSENKKVVAEVLTYDDDSLTVAHVLDGGFLLSMQVGLETQSVFREEAEEELGDEILDVVAIPGEHPDRPRGYAARSARCTFLLFGTRLKPRRSGSAFFSIDTEVRALICGALDLNIQGLIDGLRLTTPEDREMLKLRDAAKTAV